MRKIQKLLHFTLFKTFVFSSYCFIRPLIGDQSLSAQKFIDINSIGEDPISLSEYFTVFEDKDRNLEIREILQIDSKNQFREAAQTSDSISFGFSRSAFWMGLNIKNSSDSILKRFFEISYARLSYVNFYIPDHNGNYRSFRTGSAEPFSSRTYQNRYFVLPIEIPPQSEEKIYIRVESTASIIIPARLWTPEAFHLYERNDYVFHAWYFGIATALILFNLMLFISLKDSIYIYYIFSVAFMAISIAASYGLTKEYLWKDSVEWPNISSSVGYTLTIIAGILFMRKMLTTRISMPRFDYYLKAIVLILFLSIPLLVHDYSRFSRFAPVQFVISLSAMMGVGVYCSYRRQRSAYFFMAAFFVLFFLGVINAFTTLGFFSSNPFTHNSLQYGSASEMILLAFALADRFHQIRKEKEEAQRKMLESQNLLLHTLKESERVLEQKVKERTEELMKLNQKLEELSITDSLTGIANRRRFDIILADEWLRAERNGTYLSVALMDVDYFKKYNDHYGHQAGDACLQMVAEVLSQTVSQKENLVARYGGEEFVFIAPGSDPEEAFRIAESIRIGIEKLSQPHEKSEYGIITLSIGVASTIQGEDIQLKDDSELVKNADIALYEAKQNGRNRVVWRGN